MKSEERIAERPIHFFSVENRHFAIKEKKLKLKSILYYFGIEMTFDSRFLSISVKVRIIDQSD